MSGHSKWSTIKRKKGANDAARGKLFSKLSKAISVAVKTGGGGNPDMNNRLRVAVDAAKAANMPKDTIDRAIKKASETGDLFEVTYEGFGPEGVQLLIETTTDNKNRTAAEIKAILNRNNGNMGGPGSVSFNFKPVGYLLLKTEDNIEDQMLRLIDLGIEDIEESEEAVEVCVSPSELFDVKKKLEENNFVVVSSELIQKPISSVELSESNSKLLLNMLNLLDDQEDVQSVFTNQR